MPLPLDNKLLGFLQFLMRRFREDRCSQVAANLTFTALLALVPMVTIAITVISAFPAFEHLMIEVKTFILKNLVPEVAGKVISDYMEQFSQQAAGLTAVGLTMLTVTALMLMFTIENAFNTIWRTRHSRPLLHRFTIYWAMLTLGPILVGASISLTSYFVGISEGLIGIVPAASKVLLKIAPVGLATIAFSLLYLTVPNRFVPRSDAIIGGFIAALLFELMKRTFATYVVNIPTYNVVYGAFASFPIFLIWMYSCWWVVLAGAVIAAALPYWHGDAWRIQETPRQQFHDALRVLRQLHLAHEQNKGLTLRDLRQSLPIALKNLEDLLDHLMDANTVRRNQDKQYALIKRPEEIRLADIYRLFILDSGMNDNDLHTDKELASLMEMISDSVEGSLGLTLGSIFLPTSSSIHTGSSDTKTE